MDAEDDNPSSSPPSLYPSLTPSDARVSADLAQPALASASSSAVSSSPVATGPAPAASAGAIPDQAIQVRLAEDTARASSSSFDPQPAAVHPQSADAGPQPATVDALPVFEVEHVIVEAKEGPQWNVQAAPWLPGQADAEVQQQQAGSARKDSSLLPSTSMSEAAATKQQLQRQLGNLNGQAAPFVPNVKAAKRLQQEAAGMKEAAGLFEKQRAGLLQQQQADSPKISAVKVNLLSALCDMYWLLTVVNIQVTVQSILHRCGTCALILQHNLQRRRSASLEAEAASANAGQGLTATHASSCVTTQTATCVSVLYDVQY